MRGEKEINGLFVVLLLGEFLIPLRLRSQVFRSVMSHSSSCGAETRPGGGALQRPRSCLSGQLRGLRGLESRM